MKFLVFAPAFFLLCISCLPTDDAHSEITSHGVYHWKTSLDWTTYEQQALENANTETLHIRFFDLYWDDYYEEVYPKATLRTTDSLARREEWGIESIVPVIYIENEVFQHNWTSYRARNTAENVMKKIKRLRDTLFGSQVMISEIQIDCDWTASTKTPYFAFLQELNAQDVMEELGYPILSSTIRLHQVKYTEQTGIPPVNKGVLMCYNTGDIKDFSERNSIVESDEVRRYLDKLSDYPMSLDIALPLFSWGVQFRNESFEGILNDVTKADFEGREEFKTSDSLYFECISNTLLKSYFLSKGDIIRLEEPHKTDILEIISRIKESLSHNERPIHFLFYHMHSSFFKQHISSWQNKD